MDNKETPSWEGFFPWLSELLPTQDSPESQLANYSKWLEPIDQTPQNIDARVEQLCGLIEVRFGNRSLEQIFPMLDHWSNISVVTVTGFGEDITFNETNYPFGMIAHTNFEDLYSIDNLAIANSRSLLFDLIQKCLKQIGIESNNREAHKQHSSKLTIPFSEAIYELLGSLDDREKLILVDRISSSKPRTLDDVGAVFDITRERVRQIEKKLFQKIKDWVKNSEDMKIFLPQVRLFIGEISASSNLIEAFPGLEVRLEPFNLRGWGLLPALINGLEIEDNWIFGSGAEKVQQGFDEIFESNSEGIGFIKLADFATIYSSWGSSSSKELLQWAITRKYKTFEGLLLSPKIQSQTELAIAYLQNKNSPAPIEVLCGAITPGKPKRNLATRLAEDSRIVRVGPESWGLPDWELDVYDGIQNVIKRRVEAEGTVSLLQLLEELPKQYGVAENSIRTYAATFPFQLHGDEVSLAEERKGVNRNVNRVRNLYFVDEKLAFRICVNSEHLRGSGIMLSGAFAQAIGVQPGESRQWDVEGHTAQFAVNWGGGQPRASSIRVLLNDIYAKTGDQIVLIFDRDTVSISKVLVDDSSLEKKIAALCLLPEGSEVSRKSIAPAIGLPTNSVWNQIMELMRLRKDTELLELLEKYITTLT
ncbi:sigma factor-like helix-turn-helix DNA-binding protein [Aurantimicrobium minutum]|uniref:sigma factor-like helix-turn-helix DNA-binding protein n=1 Tax=Aurantimicrobium minutum TaxID=708131 RepID=UPI002472F851|nr:sigma factor-like helix-turn-helix DNA-binding protein [Aurantimicrobium minutum]